jgi:hypothetical protein
MLVGAELSDDRWRCGDGNQVQWGSR